MYVSENGGEWFIQFYCRHPASRSSLTISLDNTEDGTTNCSSLCSSHLCASLVRDEEIVIHKKDNVNTEPTFKFKLIIALTHLSASSFPPPHIPSSSNTIAIHEIFSFLILDLSFINYKNQDTTGPFLAFLPLTFKQ